ncbi:hypothetical protein [Saccharothrix lopnurensis]|uniref:Uncharacterized protein n=1 Tax=Saccharothrix lopnurensis TaxID=1670621 RepID=A0ABW1PIN0_9PSEU
MMLSAMLRRLLATAWPRRRRVSDRQLRAVFDTGLAPLPAAEVEARLQRLLAGGHTSETASAPSANGAYTFDDAAAADRSRIGTGRERGERGT